MAKVRLTKGLRLPKRGLLFPGAVLEPTPEELEVIERLGANATDKVEPAPGKAEVPEEITDAEEQLEHVEEVSRPKQAANLEAWQAFARGLGIDTKGMTKQEIIAATK
nr:MAG TPA: hypothetical protein [Caudoviricetes sp.]